MKSEGRNVTVVLLGCMLLCETSASGGERGGKVGSTTRVTWIQRGRVPLTQIAPLERLLRTAIDGPLPADARVRDSRPQVNFRGITPLRRVRRDDGSRGRE